MSDALKNGIKAFSPNPAQSEKTAKTYENQQPR
jgi:hypothetical protein